MSKGAYWIDVIRGELRSKSDGVVVGVTLHSSVRFAGRVDDEPRNFLKLKRVVDKITKVTYIYLDDIDAIEVL